MDVLAFGFLTGGVLRCASCFDVIKLALPKISHVVAPSDLYGAESMLDRVVNSERLLHWLQQVQVLPRFFRIEAYSVNEETILVRGGK